MSKTSCAIAFSISLALIALSVILGAVLKKLGKLDEKSVKKRNAFTPFNIFLIGFFIASAVMAYPVHYYGHFGDDYGAVRFFKSAMMSVVNSLQMFFMNADFAVVKDIVGEYAQRSSMTSAYTVYFLMLYVVAPFLTFGFILSFFKDALAKLRYLFYPCADLYFLSEINERSLALAKDINKNAKGKKLVVFTDVYGDKEEKKSELIAEAKKLGTVCLKDDITEIRLKRASKKYKRKFYLIGEDEDENLRQALELIDRCKATPKYNNYNTQFFVFANSKGI